MTNLKTITAKVPFEQWVELQKEANNKGVSLNSLFLSKIYCEGNKSSKDRDKESLDGDDVIKLAKMWDIIDDLYKERNTSQILRERRADIGILKISVQELMNKFQGLYIETMYPESVHKEDE